MTNGTYEARVQDGPNTFVVTLNTPTTEAQLRALNYCLSFDTDDQPHSSFAEKVDNLRTIEGVVGVTLDNPRL